MTTLMIIRTATIMTATMTIDALTPAQLQRLQTWFGASFPIGAFSYSHGLESAFEAGLVTDRASLAEWIESLLLFGSARNDAILFAEAHRRLPALTDIAELAAALSPSMELRAETLNQGEAFLKAVAQGWPGLEIGNALPSLDSTITPRKGEALSEGQNVGAQHQPWGPAPTSGSTGELPVLQGPIALPIAAGACCAAAAIPLQPALTAYLHAFVANVVSAALRSMPIGQSTGLSVQGALEPAIALATEQALAASLDDIGSASPMLDWLSATHETQYSRLFRS